MIISGANFRRVEKVSGLSFNVDLSLTNATGSAYLGFSGDSNLLKWDFSQGRVIDPDGSYVWSYQSGSPFTISGAVDSDSYTYSIESELIKNSQSRTSFPIERIITDATGVNLNFSLNTQASGRVGFSLTNSSDAVVENNKTVSGIISNTGDSLSFDILTGSIPDQFTGKLQISSTFPITVENTGVINFLGQTGILSGETISLPVELQSTVGNISNDLIFSGVRTDRSGIFSLSVDNQTDFTGAGGVLASGGAYNNTRQMFLSLEAASFENADSLSGYPVDISLAYYSGTTGEFDNVVTGVQMTATGSGYNENLIVSLDGGTPTTRATVTGNRQIFNFFDANNSGVSSVDITNIGDSYNSTPTVVFFQNLMSINVGSGGSGYTGVPSITFSGASGSGASATAVTGVVSGTQTGITSINLTNSGSGYVGSPEVIFNGGTGASAISASANLVMSSGASATALVGSYTKSFTGQFNLYTGIGGYLNYRENNYYTSPPTGYTGVTYNAAANESTFDILVEYTTSYDAKILEAELICSGTGDNRATKIISGVR
tara:strand:+ start:1687 stop:3330 length:1644 start_codon:yes stop_codon:yes gene_type:complete